MSAMRNSEWALKTSKSQKAKIDFGGNLDDPNLESCEIALFLANRMNLFPIWSKLLLANIEPGQG